MFFKKSIGRKLLQWFLLVSVVPLLIAGYLSYSHARQNLQEAIISKLTLAAVEKESAVIHLLNSYRQQVNLFATNQILRNLLASFNQIEEGKSVDQRKLMDETDFFMAIELEEFHKATDFDRSLVIGKNGKVFIDTLHRDEGEDYSQEEIFKKGSEKTFVEYRYDPQNRPNLIVSGPIFPSSLVPEEVIGVLALSANIDKTKRLLLTQEGTEGTGVIFLLDSKGRTIIHSSSEGESRPSPLALKAALQGKTGVTDEVDDRGTKILTAYRTIQEIGGGALLVSMDKEEAFAPIRRLRNRLFLIGMVMVAIVLFSSFLVSQSIIRPIQTLYKGVEEISAGRLETRVRVKTGDEIEWLTHRFNQMTDSFNQMTDKLKERTQELFAEKENLSVTLRSIGDAVITADVEGKIILINNVAETLTGWTEEEAIRKPLTEVFHIIHEKTRKRCENPVEQVLNTGGTAAVANNTILIARDGTERIIADSAAPILDKEGHMIGVVLVFRDITEKEKMEEELLKARKLESVGLLAGGIAHDFNNILTAILGNISLAKTSIHPEDPLFKRLTEAEKASLRARDLTYQLLTFSKGGAPILKTASIADLIKDSTGFALRGSSVRCEFFIPEDLWPVDIDEGQMSQVIHNLVINAVQAMPEGGVIQIRARNFTVGQEKGGAAPLPLPNGKYIQISVKDQGVGIPQEHLDKIFDPYFTTKQEGSGLGLTTSYSIIKKHEGHIAVTSELGIGSTFYLYLPASKKERVLEKELEEKPTAGKGKVLVMDDEQHVREVAYELLTHFGYEVTSAKDGAEAIELYKKAKELGKPFDLVIMDLTIPGGMGGKEAIEKLKEIDPDVKAIVSSGYSNDPVMADFRKYGFVGVVAKPYKIQVLRELLHKTLTPSNRTYPGASGRSA